MIHAYQQKAIDYLKGLKLVVMFVPVKKTRKDLILDECGCVCYCPSCKDILQDQAIWVPEEGDSGKGIYICSKCDNVSSWHFGIAPIPICLEETVEQRGIE
jgi:hypothetical protein